MCGVGDEEKMRKRGGRWEEQWRREKKEQGRRSKWGGGWEEKQANLVGNSERSEG